MTAFQSTLEDTLATLSEKIEQRLDELIGEGVYAYQNLFDAIRYSLIGGGKRLRPTLCIAAANLFGIPLSHSITPACALEFVHTYSLIHDDLPCMDDDDFRRNKPSLHKVYSDGHAILTGDCCLTFAFEVLAEAPLLTDRQKVRLTATLAKRAGAHGMVGGQVLDIASTDRQIDLPTLQMIHQMKTAAMITASVEFGGLIAQADEKSMKTLQAFGDHLGHAFQIADDILDVTSPHTHGKKRLSDTAKNKTTYPSLLGLEQAKKLAIEHTEKALKALKSLPGDRSILEGIALKLKNRC